VRTTRHLILFLFVFSIAAAQDTKEKKEAPQKEIDLKKPADTQKEETAPPKIDLPEFVITGNEKINLDIKSKTEEDEDRLYVPEKPEPGKRNLAAEGGLSPKQTKPFSVTPNAMNGKVFAGVGFYMTPQFDGWFGQHDQSNSYIINGYYSSSEGHVTDADWWKGGFGAKGRYIIPDSSAVIPFAQLSGGVRYHREAYRAYGSTAPDRIRDLNSLNISAGLGSRYALPYKSLSGFDYSGTVGFDSYGASDSLHFGENDFFVNGTATTRFFGSSFRGFIEYRTTGYTMSIPWLQSGQWFTLKADGITSLLPSLQLSYALQQWLYRGNINSASGRLYPHLELRYSLTESAMTYAGFSPSVERTTLSSLIDQNRYIDFNAKILPADISMNAYAGMEFTPFDELTTTMKFSYKRTDNYATFLDTSGAKVWEVSYLSGVRAAIFDASILYRLSGTQNITAFLTTRSVQQKDSSGSMPYVPKFSFGSVYHQFFDFGLHLEAVAEYVDSRFTNFSNTHSTAGYVYTSIKGDIELFDHFRGYGEIQNLINQHYYLWNGYRERSMYLMLGISYQW
jgi:hypothetical protein